MICWREGANTEVCEERERADVEKDNVFLPLRPGERIVGMFGGLGNQDNICTMLMQ